MSGSRNGLFEPLLTMFGLTTPQNQLAIWPMSNPVGTERLGDASLTQQRGGFDPIVDPSIARWPGRPMTESEYQRVQEGSLDLFNQAAALEGGGPTVPGRVALASTRRGTPGPPTRGVDVAPAEAPGIRAYHGSPHSFERFDTSKIGTGEGAQAYGHGLYFAENEGVARGYKRDLSGDPTIGGQPLDWSNPAEHAAAVVYSYDGSRSAAIRDLVKQVDYLRTTKGFNEASSPEAAALRYLQSGKELPALESKGHMYEVSIGADPEHFLHWDKPLSEQSQYVKDAIAKHGLAPTEADLGSFGGVPVRSAPRWADTPEQAQKLRDAGIAGIRYLDQGSRASGEGSHNYVVFDDATIDILRKYGLAGLIAGGTGAAAGLTPSRDQ